MFPGGDLGIWLVKQDIHLDEDGALAYRTKLQLSFKYKNEH